MPGYISKSPTSYVLIGFDFRFYNLEVKSNLENKIMYKDKE